MRGGKRRERKMRGGSQGKWDREWISMEIINRRRRETRQEEEIKGGQQVRQIKGRKG